ncbi:MAG: GNAT family N-acetyltransferase [Sphingobacteriales bacterium]|nr:GNAT family N-acetyltransferase [Sphingobacteriales bacterium]
MELRYKVLREPLGLVYTPEQLAGEKDEIHIVALINRKVTGVLLLKVIDGEVLKMRQVAVQSAVQLQGIGHQLVEVAEQYATRHGFKMIELHARDTAKDFYVKLNYQAIGDPFTEVGIPHYKMVKAL